MKNTKSCLLVEVKSDGAEAVTAVKLAVAGTVIEAVVLKFDAHAIFDGDPLIQVLNGRYGPFVQVIPIEGKKINVKIPKGNDPKVLTREDCISLWKIQSDKKQSSKKKS